MRAKIEAMKCSHQSKPKLSNNFAIRGLILVLTILFIPIFAYRCSLEEGPNRGIRGHTENFAGVRHGVQSKKALRYCQSCHGDQLQGGDNAEPSCLTCHGVNWDAELNGEISVAPGDHTLVSEGFRHHPGRNTPNSTCVNCHGSALEGDISNGTPSCYLCHEQKW